MGVYNYWYVTLAKREACRLVTADAIFVSNFPKQFPFVVAWASLP